MHDFIYWPAAILKLQNAKKDYALLKGYVLTSRMINIMLLNVMFFSLGTLLFEADSHFLWTLYLRDWTYIDAISLECSAQGH